MAEITGLARSRIIRGLKDLDGPALEPGRVRRAGGGRHTVTAKRIVEPATMGDPMRPLTWVSKSWEKLACELNASGHDVSPNTVGRLLGRRARVLTAGQPQDTRGREPSRSQCTVRAHQRAGDCGPVRGPARHLGRHQEEGADWQLQERRYGLSAQGNPLDVNVHDFKDKELGKVVPHGIYDPTTNAGWVNVGITHDTAEFAVQSTRLDRRIDKLDAKLDRLDNKLTKFEEREIDKRGAGATA